MTENANLYAKFAANWENANTFLTTLDGEQFTYADVHELSGRVQQLLADAGAETGDRISVQADKSIDYLWLYLGCIRGGFAFHPLNPAYTKSELKYFFADAAPSIVVCDPNNKSEAATVAAEVGVTTLFTMTSDGGGTFRDAYRNTTAAGATATSEGHDIAALLYSSGTTGQPKGIPLSHANISVNARELTDAWGFGHDDVLLHALPMFHTHGLFIALNCTLMSGSCARYLSRFDPDIVIDELQKSTVMMGVPTYYTRLLANVRMDHQACANVRLFTSGSAPLREDTFHEFERRTGHTILERYGMSETVVLTSNPIVGARKAGTVGLPLPTVELRIADGDDAPLPHGEIGQIQVRGPNVFGEYWNKPEKTAEDFTTDGYFNTGDQGCLDPEGYLSIVGRAKDLVISGGLNVYPIEVEQTLNECPLVREAAVIGVPHPDFGEAVVAVVIPNMNLEFDESEVRGFARERLASFKLPKRVVEVDDLPRNAMGKVQKNILRDRYRDLMRTE